MTASERREEVIRLRAEGLSWRQVAAELDISVRQARRDATPDATGTPQGGHTASDATPAPSSEPFPDSKAESKATEGESKASGVPIRERMASDFEGLYDEIREELGKATKLTKKIWLSCKHCNKRSLVDVPDVKSLLDTLTFLSDRGIGKPATAADEAAEQSFVFVNVLKCVDEEGADTLAWLGERGLLAKPLAVVEKEWKFGHATPPEAAEKLREIEAEEDD